MKIILSRKGFDSSAGGVPSPILPSGELRSLPIAERPSHPTAPTYRDLGLGDLVHQLSRGRIDPATKVHLDPDLWGPVRERPDGWRPLFGQSGAAETHLRHAGVDEGDLFLFYGWFRQVTMANGVLRYVPQAPDLHVLFGWLQVGRRISVAQRKEIPDWARSHPHCTDAPHSEVDSIYVSCEKLSIGGRRLGLPGGGTFKAFAPGRCLTAPGALRSLWQLPVWFHPGPTRPALTYHGDARRWIRHATHVNLQTVGRGQEFVLDSAHYPEAPAWAAALFDGEAKA